jgi:hypothetical protein
VLRARSDALQREPASFRDPDSRVFYSAEGEVLRELSAQGRNDWEALAATRFFREAVADGRLIATEALSPTLLRHDRVPFVSYPYEWPFEMLRDAALLQLELLDAALAEGLVTKDASPYNVQWRGSMPVFVDVGSFERQREGEAWAGYRQFCMLFLYPLLLQSYKGLPFQAWLRGSLDGITPAQMRSMTSLRDLFRRGVLTHVVLHARLEARYADRRRDVVGELRRSGFRSELIRANVRRLKRLVSSLRRRRADSHWSTYREASPYSAGDEELKDRFVRESAGNGRWRLAWDLGCNDGRYARAVSPHADLVVAMDADEQVVGELYGALRRENSRSILPLSVDVADASPALGWRGLERRALADRGAPDLTLCLALVHHLAITRNIPIVELIAWLRDLRTTLVVEFADRGDPMVQRLLAAKRPGLHGDYERASFERYLTDAFSIERSAELASGTRVLYLARPRG